MNWQQFNGLLEGVWSERQKMFISQVEIWEIFDGLTTFGTPPKDKVYRGHVYIKNNWRPVTNKGDVNWNTSAEGDHFKTQDEAKRVVEQVIRKYALL